jgi:hypothetical protein
MLMDTVKAENATAMRVSQGNTVNTALARTNVISKESARRTACVSATKASLVTTVLHHTVQTTAITMDFVEIAHVTVKINGPV